MLSRGFLATGVPKSSGMIHQLQEHSYRLVLACGGCMGTDLSRSSEASSASDRKGRASPFQQRVGLDGEGTV